MVVLVLAVEGELELLLDVEAEIGATKLLVVDEIVEPLITLDVLVRLEVVVKSVIEIVVGDSVLEVVVDSVVNWLVLVNVLEETEVVEALVDEVVEVLLSTGLTLPLGVVVVLEMLDFVVDELVIVDELVVLIVEEEELVERVEVVVDVFGVVVTVVLEIVVEEVVVVVVGVVVEVFVVVGTITVVDITTIGLTIPPSVVVLLDVLELVARLLVVVVGVVV